MSEWFKNRSATYVYHIFSSRGIVSSRKASLITTNTNTSFSTFNVHKIVRCYRWNKHKNLFCSFCVIENHINKISYFSFHQFFEIHYSSRGFWERVHILIIQNIYWKNSKTFEYRSTELNTSKYNFSQNLVWCTEMDKIFTYCSLGKSIFERYWPPVYLQLVTAKPSTLMRSFLLFSIVSSSVAYISSFYTIV